MEEDENLCSIVEDKKLLERGKLKINLRGEEDRMGICATTNTGSLQEVTATGDSNYDNSVTVVVDEDILNQAKEMFRLFKEEDKLKMDQLNVKIFSVDEYKDNSKPVKQLIQFFECRTFTEESNLTIAMKELERNQKLPKQDSESIRSSTSITPENSSQHGDGHESEIWKGSEIPHNTSTMRRQISGTTECNKHLKFSSECFPLNWTNVNNAAASKHNSIRVILEPGQKEYESILDDFNLSGVSLIQVEMFLCTREQREFKFEMDFGRQSRGSGFHFDIMYLYHCTELEKVSNKGLSIADKGPFGSGIYLSDNPGVCLRQIRRQTSTAVSHMLKCRVIMGDVKCYGEGVPWKENRDLGQWQNYDSAMGLTEDGLEVVVYDERRILVEYIIHLNTGSLDRLNEESEC